MPTHQDADSAPRFAHAKDSSAFPNEQHDDNFQTSPFVKETDASQESTSGWEALHATDVASRLKNLEDLHSHTRLLLQECLDESAEVQRRLRVLEDFCQRCQEGINGMSGRTGSEEILPMVCDGAMAALEAEDSAHVPFNDGTSDSRARHGAAQNDHVDELTNTDEFKLAETVWEAACVVGLPILKLSDNVSIAAGLVFNVFVQGLFCAIAYQSFTGEGFPPAEDLMRWRYTVAHDATWSDSTGASLTSRVCGGDASLIVATGQLSLVKEITQYLSVLEIPLLSNEVTQGVLLCGVAILIWLLVVMAEWHQSVELMTAMWMSFAPRTVRGGMTCATSDASLVMRVGCCRLLAMICIIGIRFAISSTLFTVGVYWLLKTTSIEDIILNAAALGFVMDLDELVFVMMLTVPVKTIVRRIEFVSSRRWSGGWCGGRAVACFPCFAWLCVAALVVCIVPELRSNVDTMEELEHFLCAGNTDFVSTIMPSTGVITVKRSEIYNDTLAATYEIKSLREAVWAQNLSNLSLPWLAPSDSWFTRAQTLTMFEFASTFGSCSDFSDDGHSFTNMLKEELSLDSWHCEAVLHLCDAADNSIIRTVCPNTCGCDHPQSSLYLSGAAYGCPQLSCRAQEQYKVALETITCSTSDVRENPHWTDLVLNMDEFLAQVDQNDEYTTRSLLTDGCEAVQRVQDQLCVEGVATSGFALWCPVECGCRVPNGGYYDVPCPPSCDQWRFQYEESLANLPCEDASALEFGSGPASTFLDLHLATFEFAFHRLDNASLWSLEIDDIRWRLTTYGCSDLPLQWCGLPKALRAVCPVICGCLEDVSQPRCRSSCSAEGVSSVNASITYHDNASSYDWI